jgi:hypothetical protein
MIFHILVTAFFFGIAIFLCTLSVMRALHVFSAWQPPDIPSDCAVNVLVGDGRGQPNESSGDMHLCEQQS